MNTIQFLWRLFRYRPLMLILTILGDTSFFLGRLFFGLILQAFFNMLGAQHGLAISILLLLGLQVLIAFVRGLLDIGDQLTSITFGFSTRALLDTNMLRRILERPGARAVPDSPGAAISSFRDDPDIVVMMFWTITLSISLSIFSLAAFIILLRINVLITLLVFLPVLGVITITQSMKNRLEVYRTASRKATATLTSAIGEIFGAVQAIQVAGAEQHVVSHFDALNAKRRSAMLTDRVLSSAVNTINSSTIGVGTGFILLLVALTIQHGQLHPGDLALFIYYLGSISDFVQYIGMLLSRYPQTKVSMNRMQDLMQGAPASALVRHHPVYLAGELPTLAQPAKTDTLSVLEAHNLSYRHPESGRGIEQINLRVPRGSLTVITGRIGSGKTTLARALLGLLPKDEGEIRWNGEIVTEPATFFVPPRSVYTPQLPHLFSDTLRANLLLGLPDDEQAIRSAIHTAVMERDVEHLEQGLDTKIGVRGVKLSGGQVQRTAAARMLIRDAELLVFDDLSSALDVETEQAMWERLFSGEERTCLVISHRKAVLQRADHIIVLKNGRVEAEGKLKQLQETCEEMQRLWHGDL